MATIPSNCIPARPDIAGIGTRISIYLQHFLYFAASLWTMVQSPDAGINSHLIYAQVTTLIFTTGALFLSAFVQATLYGMSTYHAVIVLNLGWLGLGVTLSYSFAAITSTSGGRRSVLRRPLLVPTPPSSRLGIIGILSSLFMQISLSLFISFGLWFWATIDTFGSRIECQARLPIPLVILGHTRLTTSPLIRRAFLATYGCIGLVLLLIILHTAYLLSPMASRNPFRPSNFKISQSAFRWSLFRFGAALMYHVGLFVGIVTATETMIHRLRDSVQPGESEWTYGQTVSMFLLIPALFGMIQAMGEEKGIEEEEKVPRVRDDDEERNRKRSEDD